MKIVIDPGHSGPYEPGACAAGLTEADLVLSIARRLRRRLLAAGHEVKLTRCGDIDDDGLSWRAELANDWGADLFLSIHANSAVSASAHGTEVYHYPDSVPGERLARAIQSRIVSRLHTSDRGVKTARYQVLWETDCTAILIETAFISNSSDRALLTGPVSQEEIAIAIAEGISEIQPF